MNRRFIMAGAVAAVVNLVLNAAAHFALLKDFYRSHPDVTEELAKQMARQPDQLVGWALAVSAVTMGFFIVTVIRWSGAATFSAGLKNGLIVAFLYWSSINFGIYSSSHMFSLPSVLLDLLFSAASMTVAAAVAAWVMGRAGARGPEAGT